MFSCKKCTCTKMFKDTKGAHVGLYCKQCGTWQKWLSKDEINLIEYEESTYNKNELYEDTVFGDVIEPFSTQNNNNKTTNEKSKKKNKGKVVVELPAELAEELFSQLKKIYG